MPQADHANPLFSTCHKLGHLPACEPVFEMVLSRRLQFFGHVARCDAELDHARELRAMIGPPPRTWKKPFGRPRQTWLRGVMTDLLPLNLGPNEALRRAQNRDRWRQDLETAMLRRGASL